MSIAPVESLSPITNEPSASPNVPSVNSQARPASGSAEESTQSVSGTLSKQENTTVKKVPSTYELAQDVVEVHQDPEIKDQIIVQYLDKARNLILQVPSSGELSVERGIAQESQQEAKLRQNQESAAAAQSGSARNERK